MAAAPLLGARGASFAEAAPAAATSRLVATQDAAFRPPVVVQGADVLTLDPQFVESAVSQNVFSNCFEALIHYDRDLNLVPVLAESWEVLDDDITWRFSLREGVKFHNGEPFNAEAVKFTVERTMDPALQELGLNDPFPSRSGITAVNVIDPNTVDLVLSEPNVVLPVFVTFLWILEPTYYAATPPEETARQPVGTGPWQVTEWVQDDHLTFQAFADYWRGDPGIPEIVFRPVPERSAQLNMLLAGEADIVGDLTPEDFPTVEGNPDLRISQARGTRRIHMGIPTNVPRYSDRAVRQALVQAIDYEGIANALLGPMAPPRRSNVLITGDSWLNAELQPVPFDPEAARQALEAADYPFEEQVTVISGDPSLLKGSEIAQAIAGNFRDIGINAEAQDLDWTVYTDRLRDPNGIGDMYVLSLGSRSYGPEDVSIVTTSQIWDQTRWSENTENGPVFEQLYEELLQTFDEAKQHEIVNEMQRLFVEEAVWASLWIQPAASGVNRRITWEDSGGGSRFQFWIPGDDPVEVLS